MNWRKSIRAVGGVLAAAILGAAVLAVKPAVDAERLDGTWLFDAAAQGDGDRLGHVWTSKLTIAGDRFALTRFLDEPKDLTGKFVLDPAANPPAIDLTLDEFELSGSGAPIKVPAGTHAGICKLDGDRLTVCFVAAAGGRRPTAFDAADDATIRLTLVKAASGFKEFPNEVTVRVTGAGTGPATGVTLATFMSRSTAQKDAAPEWRYYESVKTGSDGTAKVAYEKLRFCPLTTRDPETKRMAVVAVSPAALQTGEVRVELEAECRAVGTVTCAELAKAGRLLGWTNVYLMQNGRRLASSDSLDGKYEFAVPPGAYTLNAYGSELKGKTVKVVVPADRSEYAIDPIALTASRLGLLIGRPAPELDGVVGWKGEPVKLADLRGKLVLLEFWGYWCGPCVGSMPVLIGLHEKYADKGLAIVGVHVDANGDVATAAQLDAMCAGHRQKLWAGKDLPFPVALTSGERVGEGDAKERGGAAAQYGILSYPTTILIDRDGQVVGRFHARDAKMAGEQVERLLVGKK